MQVRDRSMPEVRYDTLPDGKLGNYQVSEDITTFDTSKVLLLNGEIYCETLANHESVHPLESRLSQQIGNNIWPIYSTGEREKFTLRDYSLDFVSEGIADVIARGVRNQNSSLNWPTNIEELFCGDRYTFGRYIVLDLINESGPMAISIIIRNPPKEEEIFHPQEWQNRIRQLIRNSQRRR